ncbi:MAG: 16S rRNA processing protein RimM [Bacteroidia bacterium]|nr:16S rRNA processing protein RimM [Bacteroidia bacterium]
MNKNDCFNLGYISKTVGTNGDLLFNLDVDNTKPYSKLESVFFELNNSLVPFFINKIVLRNNTAVVSIEGIDSIAKSKEYVGTSLYLPLSFLPPLKGNKFYYHEVIGFEVTDHKHGDIGAVKGVLEFPQQAILQINKNDKEILIPIKDEFIITVDRTTKTIKTKAPDGLIDLYLNSDNQESEEE